MLKMLFFWPGRTGGRFRVAAHLLTEGPFEQRVALAPHDHEEQGQVRPSAGAVAVKVQPQAHFVSVLAGVKSCKGEEWRAEVRGGQESPNDSVNQTSLPRHSPIYVITCLNCTIWELWNLETE